MTYTPPSVYIMYGAVREKTLSTLVQVYPGCKIHFHRTKKQNSHGNVDVHYAYSLHYFYRGHKQRNALTKTEYSLRIPFTISLIDRTLKCSRTKCPWIFDMDFLFFSWAIKDQLIIQDHLIKLTNVTNPTLYIAAMTNVKLHTCMYKYCTCR